MDENLIYFKGTRGKEKLTYKGYVYTKAIKPGDKRVTGYVEKDWNIVLVD